MSEVLALTWTVFGSLGGLALMLAGLIGAIATPVWMLPIVARNRALYAERQAMLTWWMAIGGIVALVAACVWISAFGIALMVSFGPLPRRAP